MAIGTTICDAVEPSDEKVYSAIAATLWHSLTFVIPCTSSIIDPKLLHRIVDAKAVLSGYCGWNTYATLRTAIYRLGRGNYMHVYDYLCYLSFIRGLLLCTTSYTDENPHAAETQSEFGRRIRIGRFVANWSIVKPGELINTNHTSPTIWLLAAATSERLVVVRIGEIEGKRLSADASMHEVLLARLESL